MQWVGPFKIDELLDHMMESFHERPPEAKGVYLISQRPWNGKPTAKCDPLYVGSTMGKSKRLRTRIGDLIADLFGFFGEETGHHSGGVTIYDYCKEHKINPKGLYIGWLKGVGCLRCNVNKVYEKLNPPLNRNRPFRCIDH